MTLCNNIIYNINVLLITVLYLNHRECLVPLHSSTEHVGQATHLITPLTKSSAAASKWGSGTDPGWHVSSKNENLDIPMRTGKIGTSFRSFSTTNSDSREWSPSSNELRRLKSTKHRTPNSSAQGWHAQHVLCRKWTSLNLDCGTA